MSSSCASMKTRWPRRSGWRAWARIMHEHGTEHLAKRAASIEKRIARMKVTDRPRRDKRMSVSFGDPNYETEDVLKVRGNYEKL